MELASIRPAPKRQFDQFGGTEETLGARVNLLGERGFLTDSKVLFLGDYDLTSLAAQPRGKNTEIWALDIDQDVLEVVTITGWNDLYFDKLRGVTSVPLSILIEVSGRAGTISVNEQGGITRP